MKLYNLMVIAFLISGATYADGFIQHADGSVTAPDDLIWYPAVKKDDGSIFTMGYYQAITCCNGPKASGYPASCPFGTGGKYLPSIDEFKTLRNQLGYGSPQGYDPTEVADLKGQNVFWSSTLLAASANSAWYFFGESGDVQYYYTAYSYPARCVGR